MESLTITTSSSRDWCSLPEEIWSEISHRFAGDRFSTTRFRSVCQFLRSITPKFTNSSLPRFTFSNRRYSSIDSFVALTTVAQIRRPNSAQSWIIKIESTAEQIRLLDSLSCCRISEITELSTFDLSQFQISELARAYSLRYVQCAATITGVEKVVLSPTSGVVFVIHDGGKLGFASDGATELTPIESRVADFNDIALFRGQPYVVDRWGTVSWIEAEMRLVQYSPPMANDGARKHLVVSSGELFVVERYLEESRYAAEREYEFGLFLRRHRNRRLNRFHPKSVDFKVYKLDEEWGKWVEVKNLGEMSFILTYDSCYSIKACEFDEFKPNRIYFTDQFDVDSACRRLGRQGGCVFDMEFGTIEYLCITPGYSNIIAVDS